MELITLLITIPLEFALDLDKEAEEKTDGAIGANDVIIEAMAKALRCEPTYIKLNYVDIENQLILKPKQGETNHGR